MALNCTTGHPRCIAQFLPQDRGGNGFRVRQLAHAELSRLFAGSLAFRRLLRQDEGASALSAFTTAR
jgi:hypothetical protein